jgi:3'-phosphoadenosine 5'-phosphosulfate sulfotransferase (PAPS reductase)/FAD synthetase
VVGEKFLKEYEYIIFMINNALSQKIPYEVYSSWLHESLKWKIERTKQKIRQYYEACNGKVYVAFSGGKDSTILLSIAREMYPDIPAVFCDTGLEYPEIKHFVSHQENITVIRPKMGFHEVLQTYGYPVVSKEVAGIIQNIRNTESVDLLRYRLLGIRANGEYKSKETGNRYRNGVLPDKWRFLIYAPFRISNKCCEIMKKKPFKDFEKDSGRSPIIGTMASDSNFRLRRYLHTGCLKLDGAKQCTPLGFWSTEDIWEYSATYGVPVCEIYQKGLHHTGCIFCMFGVHLEHYPNRFQVLEKLHPKLHAYCLSHLGIAEVLDFLGVSHTDKNTLLPFL